MIGSGIFRVPQAMILNVGTVRLVFLVWLVGGALSLAGALTYAELAAAMPGAGGEYVYLTEAYGPMWGFLYSWTQMWVAKSGSIATLATAFFEYTAHFLPQFEKVWFTAGPFAVKYGQVFALVLILVLGGINYLGVRIGGDVQVVVTAVKVGLIAFVILAGLLYAQPVAAVVVSANARGPSVAPLFAGFIAALVAALWAYDGWNNVGMVASEVRNPQRNLPLALIGGTAGVIAIYMLANWAYFRVLSPAEVGAHKLVAAEMMQRIGGACGSQRGFDRGHDFHLRGAERFHPDRRAGALCGGARRPVFPFRGARASGISYTGRFDSDAQRVVERAGAIREI